MFGIRTPNFVNSENNEAKYIENRIDDAIKAEAQEIITGHKKLTIEQMVQDIENALAYIGYVDSNSQQNSDNRPTQATTTSYSDDVEIL